MIQINHKEKCCGCEACVQICPKSCIRMESDSEGFLYPLVDKNICINCGLCEQVCPCLHFFEKRMPKHVLAIQSLDDVVREESSSGGGFTELAIWILRQNGIVFGVRFSASWKVEHTYTETIEGLAAFRGSKYVQSNVGDTYKQVRNFLKQGRWVLYVGTSCQISGLKHFLKKEYEHLLAVEVICHGVPSEKVWLSYLRELSGKQLNRITSVLFRSKITGWKNYSFVCQYNGQTHHEIYSKNIYMKGFLDDLYLRPSCYQCPCKGFATGSDLALADYWGVHLLQPELDDDKGTGIIFLFSDRLYPILKNLNMSVCEVKPSIDTLSLYNQGIRGVLKRPLVIKRKLFFYGINRGVSFSWLICLTRKLGILGWIRKYLKRR